MVQERVKLYSYLILSLKISFLSIRITFPFYSQQVAYHEQKRVKYSYKVSYGNKKECLCNRVYSREIYKDYFISRFLYPTLLNKSLPSSKRAPLPQISMLHSFSRLLFSTIAVP